jgi:hypothetical protein
MLPPHHTHLSSIPTPKIPFYTTAIANPNLDTQQYDRSALACHLFAHMKNLHQFNTKAEVAE